MALSQQPHSTPSLGFELIHRPQNQKISVIHFSVSPKGRGLSLSLVNLRNCSRNRQFLSFAASHEDSKHSEIEVEKEKKEVDVRAKETQEEWEKMLESFKEQTIKMQGMSKEAYEVYSKKAAVILEEASKKLKTQAEKTSYDLSIIAKEISEESKEYLAEAAKNSPEEMKDIVETLASSTDELKDVSRVRDFYFGIPYGAILTIGGFLSFMITGSTSSIRFGVILGAISSVLFLRELSLVTQNPSFPKFITTLISGAMVAFYLYRIMFDGDKSKGQNLESGSES
ncbi:hypothetical protein IFM89_003510 [Coptis chinensis]|uniref:Protein FATTY ACID EXPORT 3, chloroplastic n=1 Tax=Coptis chinensis TaxID=261450 RepID=A0A835HF98_9MAGN|nr:hypothetical protein IFM89_003510 [Coptis chinensis]